jgi:hypothetical protein
MINFKDLPNDTKFCVGDEENFRVKDKEDIEYILFNHKNSKNILPKIYVANKEDQHIGLYVIEDIFENVEEDNGYEDQSIDLINSLTDEEKNTIVSILNKAIIANPAYHRGEEVSFDK